MRSILISLALLAVTACGGSYTTPAGPLAKPPSTQTDPLCVRPSPAWHSLGLVYSAGDCSRSLLWGEQDPPCLEGKDDSAIVVSAQRNASCGPGAYFPVVKTDQREIWVMDSSCHCLSAGGAGCAQIIAGTYLFRRTDTDATNCYPGDGLPAALPPALTDQDIRVTLGYMMDRQSK